MIREGLMRTKSTQRNPQRYSALIIDPEQDPTQLGELPAIVARSGKEAARILGDSRQKIAGIFLNPLISSPGGPRLIAMARKLRPSAPLYLLYDERPAFDETEQARLAITASMPRPLSAKAIRTTLSPEIFDFFQDSPEETSPEPEYLPVPAASYLSGTPSPFDVYVKLPFGKHLKVLAAKDTFDPERVKTYLGRGVTTFYLRKATQGRCLSYCDDLAKHLFSRKSASDLIKINHAYQIGEEILDSIRTGELQEAELDFASDYVLQVISFARKTHLDRKLPMQWLAPQSSSYDHAIRTIFIAGLLSLPLGIESSEGVELVGLASLLHDIGLYELPEALHSENRSLMTEEQSELFETHPSRGGAILRKVPGVDPRVIDAVEQHHERRDHHGFPQGTLSDNLSGISEIVGFSSALSRLLEQNPGKSIKELAPLVSSRLADGYSSSILDAYLSVFAEKAPAH